MKFRLFSSDLLACIKILPAPAVDPVEPLSTSVLFPAVFSFSGKFIWLWREPGTGHPAFSDIVNFSDPFFRYLLGKSFIMRAQVSRIQENLCVACASQP